MTDSPATIHMMYFPWGRDQRLLEDEHEFDTAAYETMVEYAEGFDVRLWTYSNTMAFCREHYPEVARVLQSPAKPVMLVDVLRWVVVYHFGGIYWQYNTIPLAPMTAYLPAKGKNVRLFTEFELSEEGCRRASSQPIRDGEPEEATRVLIQVFSAAPRSEFIWHVVSLLIERVAAYIPTCDYDILFITGNAAASTAYDRFGRSRPDVERIDLHESRRLIKWLYTGTWRTNAEGADELGPSGVAERVFLPEIHEVPAWSRWLRLQYARRVERHPHEVSFKDPGDRDKGERVPRRGIAADEHSRAELNAWIRQLGVTSVLEAASGRALNPIDVDGVRYIGADPVREVVLENRRRNLSTNATFCNLNLFYSGIPAVDLLLLSGYLERVSCRETAWILRRLIASGSRYLCLSTHPLLRLNWDGELGDYRPINFLLEPFRFPNPKVVFPRRMPVGRRDQCLAVWSIKDLLERMGGVLKRSK